MGLVITDRTFAGDKKNVSEFSDSVGAAYALLSEGLGIVKGAWEDTDDPKGKALKDSMDALEASIKEAQAGLTSSVEAMLTQIATISSKVNGE